MTTKSRKRAVSWDDEATWPRGLVAELERLRQAGAPEDGVREAVKTAMTGAEVIGYHATRLAPDEVEVIEAEGMLPAGPGLVAARLDRQVAARRLSRSLADLLSEKSCAADGNRENRICLCLSQEPLSKETGLWRPFTYWGGEMLFGPYGDAVPHELREIGTACIVELQVPLSRLRNADDFMASLFDGFLSRRTGTSDAAREDYVIGPIAASGVRRIIQRSDPEFEELTGCHSWDDPIT